MRIILALLFVSILAAYAQSGCKDIHIITDNLSGSTKFESPLTYDMQYSKTVSKSGDTVYRLYLQTVVSYTNTDEKGCILYLSDGSKLEFPDQMVSVTDMTLFRYKYSAIVTLQREEINRLLQFDIVDFRLHIHNTPFSTQLAKKKNARILTDYLKCIVAGKLN